MTDPRIDYDSAVATGRGDDGTTALLFGGERVSKDDLRTEAYGAVDEAVAALGLARAELSVAARAGDLSPDPGAPSQRPGPADPARAVRGRRGAGHQPRGPRQGPRRRHPGLAAHGRRHGRDAPRDGGARSSSPRSSSSRARRACPPASSWAGPSSGAPSGVRLPWLTTTRAWPHSRLLPYLNRLADLLWVLARAAEQAEAQAATVARPERKQGAATAATSPERSER